MKSSKALIPVALAATTLLALTACSSGSSSSGGKSDAKITISYVSPDTGNGYQESFQCGVIAAAKKAGVTLKLAGSQTYSASAQIPVLNSVAATKPDAVITAATDASALKAPFQQLTANGSKLVIYDDPNNQYGNLADAQVTADHYTGGLEAAKQLVAAIGTKGTVLPIDIAPGNPSTNARNKGFHDGIAKYPGIRVLPTQYDGDDQTKDGEIVSSTLAAHSDLAAVVGVYDSAGEGALTALKAANKVGTVKIVTFDADPALVTALKAGQVSAIVDQAPFTQSQKAVQLAIDAVKGTKIAKKVSVIPMPVVTKANVDTPSIKKELYVSKGCTN